MNVLRSRILEIDGRLYINYQEENSVANQENHGAPTLPLDEIDEGEILEDSTCFEKTENGYLCSMKAPSPLFKYIIGRKGETKRRLEQETKTRISIPPQGKEGDIRISSKLPANIEAAKNRIELILSEKRWREPCNYFISIPLRNSQIRDGFREFQDMVLSECSGDRGVENKLFQNVEKLHLTIAMLTLLSEDEYQRAIEALEAVKEVIAAPPDPCIEVKGTEYMNDDPEMVDVLYAKVACKDGSAFLQELADAITDKFQAAGLSRKEHDHVKLHATIMNTLLTAEKPMDNQRPLKRITFNARRVLDISRNFKFGEFKLNEIHISRRFSTGADGYYESMYVLKI